MRVYIAGTFHDPRISDGSVVREVQALGHEVVSTWHHEAVWKSESHQRSRLDRQTIAEANYRDIDRCETMLVVPMDGHHLCGAHTETGYAIGTKKRVVILGDHASMNTMTVHKTVEYITSIDGLGRAPEPEPLRCDKHGCKTAPAYECNCSRCFREPQDERFHACDAHRVEAGISHVRVRDYHAQWCKMTNGWKR